jgi:hypothetical protein
MVRSGGVACTTMIHLSPHLLNHLRVCQASRRVSRKRTAERFSVKGIQEVDDSIPFGPTIVTPADLGVSATAEAVRHGLEPAGSESWEPSNRREDQAAASCSCQSVDIVVSGS